MDVDPTELAEAVALLSKEFPEASPQALLTVLKGCACDLPAARRRLYELQRATGASPEAAEAAQPAAGSPTSPSAAADNGSSWSWSGFQQSMRSMGLESFGAQLSLLSRQVASSLNAVIPAELNPFGYDDEALEAEEERAAAKAAYEAEVERETVAVAASARQLQSRRHQQGGGRAAGSPLPSPRDQGFADEDGEDDDKLN